MNIEEQTETNTRNNVCPQSNKQKSNCYLEQRGKRNEMLRVDYVIVLNSSKMDRERNKTRRQIFEDHLRAEGLILEYDKSQDGKRKIIKLHCSEEAILKYAEIRQMKLPLKKQSKADENRKQPCSPKNQFITCIEKAMFSYKGKFYREEKEEEKVAFSLEKKDKFRWNEQDFFTNAQRCLITGDIITRTIWEEGFVKHMGIQELIRLGCYESMFPLHDGPPRTKIAKSGPADDRNLLIGICGNFSNFFKTLPLDLIRKYFGEKVAFYFSWMEFYTFMLILPALCGLTVFVFGILWQPMDIPTRDVCNKTGAGNYTLCPDCDKVCTYTKLYDSCLNSVLGNTVDNYLMVPYGLFVSVWAALTIQLWKRRQSTHQYQWEVVDNEDIKVVRPEYERACKRTRISPITGTPELYIPRSHQIGRYVLTVSTAGFMILLVLAFMVAMIIYRVSLVATLSRYYVGNELFRKYIRIFTTMTGSLIQLVFMLGLNFVYRRLSIVLTNFERPRTQTEYDYWLTIKVYCFQFVNNYGPLYYTAFFKHSFIGNPAQYDYTMKFRQEECDATGCLFELSLEFVIIFMGLQFSDTFRKIIKQRIKRQRKLNQIMQPEVIDKQHEWELDIHLKPVYELRLFDDYLESVMQFGYLSLFASAMPLMPLLALVNNIIQIRIEALDWLLFTRRPYPQRATDIGLCQNIMQFLVILGAVTNACVIAYTSTSIQKFYYLYYVNATMENFTEFRLSIFNTADFQNQSIPHSIPPIFGRKVDICRYPDLRLPPNHPHKYEYRREFWHILAAKLGFIVCYEHLVLILTYLIGLVISDKPKKLRLEEERKKYRARDLLFKAELNARAMTSTSAGKRSPKMYQETNPSDGSESDENPKAAKKGKSIRDMFPSVISISSPKKPVFKKLKSILIDRRVF